MPSKLPVDKDQKADILIVERKGSMSWSGGLVDWVEGDTAYISVVFSWQRQAAYQKAVWHKALGRKVVVGGPATSISSNMFGDMIGKEANALVRHNPEATFTSRGCIRNCPFCIVPRHEGKLVELDKWDIKPIVCDNNILATSRRHFSDVIDKLKSLKGIDFNQGLDARLLTKHHAERLRELDTKMIRLAWDHIGIEQQWVRAWQILVDAGFAPYHIQSYVLLGFNDTPEDALYRLETIKKLGSLPNPMRYQPLDSERRNSYIHPNWTERQLKDYMRYWSRQIWLGHISFAEYCGV